MRRCRNCSVRPLPEDCAWGAVLSVPLLSTNREVAKMDQPGVLCSSGWRRRRAFHSLVEHIRAADRGFRSALEACPVVAVRRCRVTHGNQMKIERKVPPLRIGNACIFPPLVLAPMAGVTDMLYRRVMSRYGVGLVTTEMVSVQGILRDQRPSWDLCAPDPLSQVPTAVQLFGRDAAGMAEAARRVEAGGAFLVDINAGCPVKKVVRQGAGASLLKTPDVLAGIVDEVRRAVKIPVTVKLRVGWDHRSTGMIDLVRMLASAGADAVSIHGRTAVQMYSGRADWSWIRRVKDAVGIPVIGNGDVTSPSHADRMIEETGCDAVMIGRASQGNPWLLGAIASRWGYVGNGGGMPGWRDFVDTVHEHIGAFIERKPRAVGHLRKLLIWYSKGCPNSTDFRYRISRVEEPGRLLGIFDEWVEGLMEKDVEFLPCKVPGIEYLNN